MSLKKIVYPYIPNSVPATKEAMLKAVNAKSGEEFSADIPDSIRLKRKLKLPEPLFSEAALVRHVEGLLSKNRSTREMLSFLGAGCAPHHIPAVCDEVNSRSEFLPATIMPDKLSMVRGYIKPDMNVELIPFDPSTGLMDLNALRKQVNGQTAAVFIENPSYLGFLERQREEIGRDGS